MSRTAASPADSRQGTHISSWVRRERVRRGVSACSWTGDRLAATMASTPTATAAAPAPSEADLRKALQRHWAASDAGDFKAEHEIYDEEAVLDYPQSGERICGRAGIQASRMAQPNRKCFTVRRILGSGRLWISELVL